MFLLPPFDSVTVSQLLYFPPSSWANQASAVILQSEQAGSHPLFIVSQIHYSSFIHTLFNYPPLVLIKRPSLLAPLPLRHMLYLVCPSLPPSVRPSVSVRSSHHPSSPCIIDLTSLCRTGPRSLRTPVRWVSAFSLALDTPHSETATGQPLVVHLRHFKLMLSVFQTSNAAEKY